jgi:surface polysaccharide O-acyltransferase-like enzyme
MSAQATAPKRMIWFDACRVLAAIGVVLIHSSTDSAGQPFPSASLSERIFPAVMRGLSEISSSEIFIVFSLFLLAMKLDRRDDGLGATLAQQFRRLAPPFFSWTLFYAGFRLLKACAFGYGGAIVTQLADPTAWLGYVLLGSAQYHLHFLPELLAVIAFYPLMRGAVTYPLLGLLVIPSVVILELVQGHIWTAFSDPLLRDYTLRAFKILAYVGYGFASFALFGLWKRGIDPVRAALIRNAALYACLLLILGTVSYLVAIAQTGSWVARPIESYLGHALLPVAVFALFLGMKDRAWHPAFSKLAAYTFGVYLTHPIAIDVFDVAVHLLHLAPAPWLSVVGKWGFSVGAAFAMAHALSVRTGTAWLVGLGPVPFTTGARSVAA